MSVIKVSQLKVAYNSDAPVLNGIDFEINKGEAVALLGHNGSGKSTLLKSLVGIIKPNDGSIVFDTNDLSQISKRQLRKLRSSTGLIFQNHNLVSRVSVLSNVIHGHLGKNPSPRLWYQFLSPNDVRELAYEKLQAVKLEHLASRRADQLSGGQSQRVAIARALMQEPKVIFADEPTASLDPQAGTDVMELLHSLCKAKGITLIFTTHDLEHAKLYSDRTIALKNGGIELDQATNEIDFSLLNSLYE